MQTTTVQPSTYQSMRGFAVNAIGTGDEQIESATREWLDSLTPSELEGFIYPLARAQMRNILRAFTREAIHKATTEDWSLGQAALSNPCARMDLRDKYIWIPGEDIRVAVLLATEAQHLARAEWQESKAAGCIADAKFHHEAVRLIREAGVNCLADLPDSIS